jgi:signal transduction histidine kinase
MNLIFIMFIHDNSQCFNVNSFSNLYQAPTFTNMNLKRVFMISMPLKRRLYIDFAVMLLLALVSGVASYLTFQRHVGQSHSVEHTYTVINETANLQGLILDIEGDRTGYLSTADDFYLSDHAEDILNINKSIDRLKKLIKGNVDQDKFITDLQNDLAPQLIIWRETNLGKIVSDKKAIQDLLIQERANLDNIYTDINALRNYTNLILIENNKKEDASIKRAYLTSVAGYGLILIIVMVLIYYVVKEINKRNKLEAELENSLAKEKDLNEIKSLFVSMASHEFRSPLSVILSSASLISKYHDNEQQPQRDRHIKRISSSVSILTQIMNNFLSLGKIESGQIKLNSSETNIDFQLNEYIDETKHLLKDGQHIQYRRNGAPDTVFIDGTLLRHITVNLLSNAIKYSPDHSEIELFAGASPKGFKISVKDNGIGIPKDEQENLFKKFHRFSNASNIQGSGLGLHIVDQYVHLMGGSIECHSEAGLGTEFIVHLPAEQ